MKDIERLEETVVSGTKSQRSAAAYQLYWIIRDGDGTSPDKRRAMKYLRAAAEYGSIEAMSQMGWHYDTGTFVGRNIVKAIDWYRKAADKGDGIARRRIRATRGRRLIWVRYILMASVA